LEQAKNAKDVDGRCDIYALGCMLYCMLTGNPPFMGENIVEVIKTKEIGTFPPSRQANRDVPERLDLIITKMTAKDPKHRYLTCGDLVKDLEGLELAGDSLSFYRSEEQQELQSDLDWKQENQASSNVTKDVWFLRRKQLDGTVSVKQFTTSQLIELVEKEQIPPSSKICQEQTGNYRSLAAYKEFEQAALKLVSKKGADRQTRRYRNLYKKIEQEGDNRKREWAEADKEQDEVIDNTLRTGVIALAAVVGAILQFSTFYLFARALFG